MWGWDDRAQGYALQPDGSSLTSMARSKQVQLPPGRLHARRSPKGFEDPCIGDGRRWIGGRRRPSAGATYRLAALDRHAFPRLVFGRTITSISAARRATTMRLRRWVAAEDIHVGNILEMGDFWATLLQPVCLRRQGRCERAGRILSPGQEEPRTPEIGHTISLGAEPVREDGPRVRYSDDRLFDRVHSLGGMTGFAHQAVLFSGYRGLVLNAVRGKVDFLELLQFCIPQGPLAVEHYYLMLDLGIRLTALAGSDFPWCGRGFSADRQRPLLREHGRPTVVRALVPVAQGRPHVRHHGADAVADCQRAASPGEIVDVTPGTRLTITAEAWGEARTRAAANPRRDRPWQGARARTAARSSPTAHGDLRAPRRSWDLDCSENGGRPRPARAHDARLRDSQRRRLPQQCRGR